MIKLTQEELRAKLNDELQAVKASYICTVTGINKDVLSGFKRNKMNFLPNYRHISNQKINPALRHQFQ
jgi:hypothetical protein